MMLARRLTNQAWNEMGEGPDNLIKSTTDKQKMVQRIVAVLERLLDRVISNRTNSISKKFLAATSSVNDEISSISTSCLPMRKSFSRFRLSDRNNNAVEKTHTMSSVVREQLLLYVEQIAERYRDVYYHNFQHATHVTLSANKLINILLSCEYAPHGRSTQGEDFATTKSKQKTFQRKSKDKSSVKSDVCGNSAGKIFEKNLATFGISSDPLSHFALVFSALIHDVEHKGLPNSQLVKEMDKLSSMYPTKSIAEQHSITVGLSLLSENRFKDLKRAIYVNKEECVKFNTLVSDIILCTDISNPERLAIGKSKWNAAFPTNSTSQTSSDSSPRRHSDPLQTIECNDFCNGMKNMRSSNSYLSAAELSTLQMNLKANVVMEQFIQIADVAHLMQDYSVFLKWNKHLYDELWAAKIAGRGFDPTEKWYECQISFFDNYVIPLSTRISESGIFGIEGRLFLTNAINNKERWIQEGKLKAPEMSKNVSYVRSNTMKNTDVMRNSCVGYPIISTVKRSSAPNRSMRAA